MTNGSIRDLRRQLRDQITKSIDGIALELEQAKQEADALAISTKWWLIGAASAGVAVAIGLLSAIAVYGITRPLGSMTSAMGRLAAGDLDVSVTGVERRDEVGLLARSLQVFKDNALDARRLAAAQDAENQAKMRRAEMLDQITKRFESNVSALTQGLSSAAQQTSANARS